MIVGASSNPGDIVLDCFAGSGTTLAAAYETGRNWIGVDNSTESIKAIWKRFVTGLEVYGDYVKEYQSEQTLLDVIDKSPFEIWVSSAEQEQFKSIELHGN